MPTAAACGRWSQKEDVKPMLRVGQKAPDFVASAYVNGEITNVRLADYRGRWVVLVFYPLDFTFVCPTELLAFAGNAEEFKNLNAEVIAISVDSVYSHKAWVERDLKDLRYPIASDITKQISREYGVLDEEKGVALRGTFVIDPEGVVQYEVVSALNLGRSTDETLRALEALQTGELCPANWRPGAQTLGPAA
jgi:alkyl hydroperoxide reductase subunit AhpC